MPLCPSNEVTQTGNTTAIRLRAVRETGVCRHHGGLIEGAPEIPPCNNAEMHWGVSGVPSNSSIMPRDASLSYRCTSDRCCFFQWGHHDEYITFCHVKSHVSLFYCKYWRTPRDVLFILRIQTRPGNKSLFPSYQTTSVILFQGNK